MLSGTKHARICCGCYKQASREGTAFCQLSLFWSYDMDRVKLSKLFVPVKYFTCFGAFSLSLEARQPWLSLPVQFMLSQQTNLHQFKPSIKHIHPYLQPLAQTGNSSCFCWKNKMFLAEEMKESSSSVISCVWIRKGRGVLEERPEHCPATHRSTTASASEGRVCPEAFLQSK